MGPRETKTKEEPATQEIKDAAINAINSGDTFFLICDKGESYLVAGSMSKKNIVENFARYIVENDLFDCVQAYGLYCRAQGQMFKNAGIEQQIKDLIEKFGMDLEEDDDE